jgi:predicted DNA-binding transcriptional regulator AlpA
MSALKLTVATKSTNQRGTGKPYSARIQLGALQPAIEAGGNSKQSGGRQMAVAKRRVPRKIDKILAGKVAVVRPPEPEPEPEKYLTDMELAALLRVSIRTIFTYGEKGLLTKVRLGPKRVVYLKSEVDALLAASTKAARKTATERAKAQSSLATT